ncbi:MAG: triose-phosphate isomerase [Candidatus Aenigmarchaeota archaeon]|nr:triose-phosphate isomerase [Candidatus Aenigmarchaeota archaeon]
MKVKTPIIIVNFKTYEEATGKKAVKLAKICEYVSKKYDINIAISPQFCDIFQISQFVKKILILSQHIDSIYPGPYTGHISPLSIKQSGAIGTLINHSERKLDLEKIRKCIELTKKYGLISVCCSANVNESKEIAKFDPDFIAYEPPSLIGTGISVSQTKPEVVTKTVNEIKKINPEVKVLCGAGIMKGEDVKKALELGTVGVILSSGVVKAVNPKKVLIEFAESIK